jgi:hypothetical protein
MDLSAPHGWSVFFLAVCSALFAGLLAWCGYRAVRRREPVALLILAGGLLATVIEPLLDNLGLLWFARNNVGIAFQLFDRYMPVYVVLGYGFYFGGQAFIAYDGLRNGKQARFLWTVYAAAWVFDLAIESTGHLAGLYRYYGPQPFNLWGVPLWWMFVNPALPVVAGLIFFRLGDRLRAGRAILVVPLLAMTYGGIYGATSWPIFVALHSSDSTPILYASGVVTDAFALIVVWLAITLLVPAPTGALNDHEAAVGLPHREPLPV